MGTPENLRQSGRASYILKNHYVVASLTYKVTINAK